MISKSLFLVFSTWRSTRSESVQVLAKAESIERYLQPRHTKVVYEEGGSNAAGPTSRIAKSLW